MLESRWYRRLRKPPWQPPGPVFGPVWTVIYALIAASMLVVRGRGGDAQRPVFVLFGTNLALNLAWTLIFFRGRSPLAAGVEILALEGTTVALVVRAWPVSRLASLLLVPYAVWIVFATALTWAIWARNARPRRWVARIAIWSARRRWAASCAADGRKLPDQRLRISEPAVVNRHAIANEALNVVGDVPDVDVHACHDTGRSPSRAQGGGTSGVPRRNSDCRSSRAGVQGAACRVPQLGCTPGPTRIRPRALGLMEQTESPG